MLQDENLFEGPTQSDPEGQALVSVNTPPPQVREHKTVPVGFLKR